MQRSKKIQSIMMRKIIKTEQTCVLELAHSDIKTVVTVCTSCAPKVK